MKEKSKKIVSSAIPKYRQLLMILRNQILTGELAPGVPLPSEADLIQTYQLSRGTIRRAMAQLEAERLIETEHGVGSFVRTSHPNAIPFRFKPPILANRQSKISQKVIAQETVSPPMHILEELQLPLDSKVIHIARQQLMGGEIVAYSERYIVQDIMPSLAEKELDGINHLHDLLVTKSEFPLLRAEIEIEAHRMDQEEANLLECEAGTPAIVIKRKTFTAPNRPAVWYYGLYKQEFNLSLKIDENGTSAK